MVQCTTGNVKLSRAPTCNHVFALMLYSLYLLSILIYDFFSVANKSNTNAIINIASDKTIGTTWAVTFFLLHLHFQDKWFIKIRMFPTKWKKKSKSDMWKNIYCSTPKKLLFWKTYIIFVFQLLFLVGAVIVVWISPKKLLQYSEVKFIIMEVHTLRGCAKITQNSNFCC